MDINIDTETALGKFSKRELGDIKVLMIEDDVFFSDLVLAKLSLSGCIPYSTQNGEEAVALAEQYKPNIVILDLMLPGISGEEVLGLFKNNEELKSIPVIVFSNKSDDKTIQACLDMGSSEYLVKSATDLNKLVEILKSKL
jgi:two-component system phosphate regulon response regulator PhoB